MDRAGCDPLPPHVQALLAKATCSMLPEQSESKYEKCYENYIEWAKSENVEARSSSEEVLVAYFCHLSATLKNATLWSKFSMIKLVMKTRLNIDIDTYNQLKAFLKKNGVGAVQKKSNTLMDCHIQDFLLKADDKIYLATKVALIFGVCGALRSGELVEITTKDISTVGGMLKVFIPHTKTHVSKFFIVDDKFMVWVNKNRDLRPSGCRTDRFFLNFQKGKCTRQPIGKNKLCKFPQEIARFLCLPEPTTYTGHCFRRTSATLLANTGADIETIKRHGKWKSPDVARGYIDESVKHSASITKQLTSSINIPSGGNGAGEPMQQDDPSTATPSSSGPAARKSLEELALTDKLPFSITINNCPNLQLALTK